MTTNLEYALKEFEFSKALRRDFHQHPELGYQEIRTSGIIADMLRNLGYRVTTGVARTGVIGLLRGKPELPVILLRFDMDALPVLEKNATEYVSTTPGVMHACGHDAHVAIGLTVAKILALGRENHSATIKIVFQPAEEGLGGAEEMIKQGVLTDPKPDFCIGVHVWNEKPVGWVGASPGPIMAGADTFEIKVNGKGGHGGHPHKTTDPILAAAQIVLTAQTIISRNLSPLDNAVLSFCKINGGEAFNVIPDQVIFGGTIRSYLPDVRSKIIDRLEAIVQSIARAHQCAADFKLNEVTPAVINDEDVIADITPAFFKNLPNLKIDSEIKTMVSEDFSFFLNQIPGCFLFIGSANEDKGFKYGHHHPQFDIDEDVLPIATAVVLEAVDALSR